MNRIVIVGGGIAGLSIAFELRQMAPDMEVVLLEGSGRVGGNIRSEHADGYICEWGPDGFLDNSPPTLDLVRRLGLESRLRPSRPDARRRFIYRHGRLHEVPLGPLGFARTRLLSTRGKLRILAEPLAARRPERDESIHEFAERRIGREAAEVMVGSMVSGIFAGDAQELSLRACFPKMWDMETEYGSLVRAMIAKRRQRRPGDGMGAPTGTLTSFADGMQELPRALGAALPEIVRTGSPVLALRRRDDGIRPVGARRFSVISTDRPIEADAVVLAGPADFSADLVRPFDATLAGVLNGIPTASLAVACLGYDAAALEAERGPLNGFGFLAPRGEGLRILGALWETSIYEGRAPRGRALIRAMIGGATDREAASLTEAELTAIVRADLHRSMGLTIDPVFVKVIRHRRGIPQYTVGHPSRLARAESLLKAHPGLVLAGNSYRGVSINSCIAEAPGIARQVVEHLRAVNHASSRLALAR
jgi:oxygen-dependent protoporphyrinogen oxidase